jgi:hypothetical protein
MSRLKKLYNVLLSNGDLFEVFDGMSGNWEEDKNHFIQVQTDLESQIKNINEEYID